MRRGSRRREVPSRRAKAEKTTYMCRFNELRCLIPLDVYQEATPALTGVGTAAIEGRGTTVNCMFHVKHPDEVNEIRRGEATKQQTLAEKSTFNCRLLHGRSPALHSISSSEYHRRTGCGSCSHS